MAIISTGGALGLLLQSIVSLHRRVSVSADTGKAMFFNAPGATAAQADTTWRFSRNGPCSSLAALPGVAFCSKELNSLLQAMKGGLLTTPLEQASLSRGRLRTQPRSRHVVFWWTCCDISIRLSTLAAGLKSFNSAHR